MSEEHMDFEAQVAEAIQEAWHEAFKDIHAEWLEANEPEIRDRFEADIQQTIGAAWKEDYQVVYAEWLAENEADIRAEVESDRST